MQQNKIIILPNGEEVLDLTPTLEGKLAIVHLEVIKRLASLLPNVSLNDIKSEIIEKLTDCTDLPTLVSTLADEIAFHRTVNVINTINAEDVLLH